jgi:hypothetical protein
MHCPGCGNEAKKNQKFCRACGFGLEQVAQLLSAERTTGRTELTEDERRTEKLVGWGINALLGILGLSVVAAIIYAVMIRKGAFWTGLGFIGFLTCVVLLLWLIGKWTDLQEAKSARRKLQPHPLPSVENTAKLLAEAQRESASSVTERTTELLAVRSERLRSGELNR